MNLRTRWTICLSLALLCPAQPFAQAQQYSYAYDASGRLIAVSHGNGTTLNYAYDENGNLTEVTTALSESIFANGFEEATP